MESLDIVGQRGQHVPAEAAGRHHVVSVARGGRLHDQFVVERVDQHDERGIGGGRPDQPGAHFVDREPQVRHGVEIQILEGADGTNQGAQHRQVLQACRNMQLHGAMASLTLTRARSRIVHLVSRQRLTDTTTALQPAVDRRLDSVGHTDRQSVGRTRSLRRS